MSWNVIFISKGICFRVFSDDSNIDYLLSREQSLLLLASLLPERAAAESVWSYLKETSKHEFFQLLHQCLVIDEIGKYIFLYYCLVSILSFRIWKNKLIYLSIRDVLEVIKCLDK